MVAGRQEGREKKKKGEWGAYEQIPEESKQHRNGNVIPTFLSVRGMEGDCQRDEKGKEVWR